MRMIESENRILERQAPAEETRAECVYVSQEENRSRPRYMGNKKCPLGEHNEYRWECKAFYACVDAFILRMLRKRCLPLRLLEELRPVVNGPTDIEYGFSDYVLLTWIGHVSTENGYDFGRKSVDKAIRESNVPEDADLAAESADIRQAFGVHGSDGMRRREKRPCRANKGAKCRV